MSIVPETVTACYAEGSDGGTSDCRTNSIYSNTAGQAASRLAQTSIGKGMENTNHIHARLTTAGGAARDTYAAGVAWAYTNNGKTDWHLPSKDEVNQMCKWQRGQAWVSDATICDNTGALNSGPGASGFAVDWYPSSSEWDASNMWAQNFPGGNLMDLGKQNRGQVRPVRAFG
jgi:hypothetical protein